MATDATGAPTPLGIPKFNTSADAPSGLGGNAQMDALDALIAARVVKPAGIAASEVPVWDGAAWVRSSATKVGVGSLGSGTPDATKFLRGDGSWQVVGAGPTITYATAPPGSPANGDIWYMVDSTSAPTYVWAMRYNASEATYKWEFAGGAPLMLLDDPNVAVNTLTQVGATGLYYKAATLAFTTPRAGDWQINYVAGIDNNADGNIISSGVFQGSTIGYSYGGYPVNVTAGHVELQMGAGRFAGLASSTVIGAAFGILTKKLRQTAVSITPMKVS